MPSQSRLEAEYKNLLRKFGLLDEGKATSGMIDGFFDEFRNTAKTEGTGINILDGQDLEKIKSELVGEVGFNSLLQEYGKDIENSIGKLGKSIDKNVYIGQFPTGSFNAQVCPVLDGGLILINTGLMMFIYQVAKIMSFSMVAANFDEKGQPIEKTVKSKSQYSHEQIVSALSEVVLAYLIAGHSTAAQRFPAEGGFRGIIAGNITTAAEKFVIAHEYGHVIAGHLNSPRTIVAKSGVGEINLISKSWQQEMEADALGAYIMIAGEDRVIDSPEKLFNFQILVAGILFFFSLDDLITSCVEGITGRQDLHIMTDHPPSAVRLKMLQELFKKIGNGDVLLQFSNVLLDWYNNTKQDVIDSVKKQLR